MRKKVIKEVVKEPEWTPINFVLKTCQRFPTHACFEPVTDWKEMVEVKGNQEITTKRATCRKGHENEIITIKNLDFI
jgi:hypothetical protein